MTDRVPVCGLSQQSLPLQTCQTPCESLPACTPPVTRMTATGPPARIHVRLGVPGPPGPPGNSRIHRFYFDDPALEWTAAHGGKTDLALIQARDQSGRMINAQIDVDATQFTVRLTSATAGYVDVLVNAV